MLITGENGAGKELVAHAIHALSKRATRPFVKINCAAIPQRAGRERAVRPRAAARSPARVAAQARAGSSWPTAARCSSTRSATWRSTRRPSCCARSRPARSSAIGGTRDRCTCDVRFIAATNKDLAGGDRAGEFREDLFYRLNVRAAPRAAAARAASPTSARSREHFLDAFCGAEGAHAEDARRTRRARCSRSTAGRATCASCAISWSARSSWSRATGRSAPRTWRRGSRPRPASAEERRGCSGEIERRESEAIRRALETGELERHAGRRRARHRPHQPPPQDAQVRHPPAGDSEAKPRHERGMGATGAGPTPRPRPRQTRPQAPDPRRDLRERGLQPFFLAERSPALRPAVTFAETAP